MDINSTDGPSADPVAVAIRSLRTMEPAVGPTSTPYFTPTQSTAHCQLEQSEGDFRRFASVIHQVACDL